MHRAIGTPPEALDKAITYCQLQGFHVMYHDDYLAQLIRLEMPDRVFAALPD